MSFSNKKVINNLQTKTKPTWCPGCYNFQILAGVKNAISKEINKNDFAIVSGIGCHAKIFDYLNLNGINSIHGRVSPTCLGLKIGNPNLNVIGFSGDGDSYAEGISHLIHSARYNSDFNLIVHNNQVFALTVGQPTPTSEKGFIDKTNPQGNKINPLNPIKLMLASGCGFVARVFADLKQVENVLNKAMKHKGFSFIEIIQPCIVFHPDNNHKDKFYFLEDKKHDKTDINKAMKRAEEFDYNKITKNTKIPLGIFYQEKKPVFEEQFTQLNKLKQKNKSWKDIKR
ncbi:MAG: thiamine pyrophosphate-dependent enzyme [Nanoarchaeota archaeon]